MSKYWNKMEIMRQGKRFLKNEKEKGNDGELFISQDRPAFFVNKDYYTVKTSSNYDFSDNERKSIADFYGNNYRIDRSNNTIMVSKNDLDRFLNTRCELLTLHTDKLIGSIVSLIIPLHINVPGIDNKILVDQGDRINFYKSDANVIVFACASFLILDSKMRGKGMGMALIQESLQILYDNGGLGAYFINKVSRCDNSLSLVSWYYPLNFDKLDACKYDYSRDYKSYFVNNLEGVGLDVKKVVEENARIAYDFYFNSMKGKKFYFSPSYEYWLKWLESFPTYILLEKSEIVGLFCFNSDNIRYPLHRVELMTGKLIICIGKQPETLKSSLFIAKSLYDMLTLYQVGDLNEKVLTSVFAQKSHKSYINFFNTRLLLSASDFHAPLF